MTDQTSPLTEQQLDEIEQRANAATPGPWEPYHPEYGPTFYANTTGEHLRGVGDLNFGVGDEADADETFVRHARQDVDALLAYVRRFQGQRKYLIGQLAKRDAESGRGDEAVRAFLAGEPTDEQPAVEESGWCSFGEGDAPGSGCILPAGHEPANRHVVTPGDTNDEDL